MDRRTFEVPATLLAVSLLAFGAASTGCSSGGDSANGKGKLKGDGGPTLIGNGTPDGGAFAISPQNPNITVNPDGSPPTPVQFTVSNTGGATVTWTISNPYLGTIDSNGLFTPGGRVGGSGDIEVRVDGKIKNKVHISVTVADVQNGSSTGAVNVDAGAGGLGGVGGEGLGGPVSDAILKLLQGTPTADASIQILYPYDQTVFPLDILPPLYQWTRAHQNPDAGTGTQANFDAIYIHLSSPPYYDYKGYFSKPASLTAAQNFVRHPLPKSVWAAATNSAAGSTLSVEIVLSAGGKAYGPIKQSYKIALAPFNGRIYYQSYATAFVTNSIPSEGNVQWDSKARFGAATLSIDVGAEAPKLVAGADGDDNGSGCRVCHSVSAYGDRMIAQHGDQYAKTSSYDLKNGNTETYTAPGSAPPTPLYGDNTVRWAGLSPDGSMGLGNSIDVASNPNNHTDTKLYDMVTGKVIPSPGLNEFATTIGLPSFSPDGKHVAFTFFDGPGAATIGGTKGRELVTMDFDATTHTFSNPKKLWEPPAPNDDQRPAFNTFLPTSNAVVFQRRWQGTDDQAFASWHGARSELWWVDVATGKAAALDRVNGIGADGKSYLPKGPNGHDQDERLNYDPSVSPVGSGGYAWMVFMSRREYGNIATRGPWESDPRSYDTRGANPSTKKIWLAAIDLNAKPGTDPSHPAFYIPGQELNGINSRPFFALKPCMSDSGTCATGIDCCSGFCRDGLCRPKDQNSCSQLEERCATKSDCCDAASECIGGFCEVIIQ